jgi:hypothetical protein
MKRREITATPRVTVEAPVRLTKTTSNTTPLVISLTPAQEAMTPAVPLGTRTTLMDPTPLQLTIPVPEAMDQTMPILPVIHTDRLRLAILAPVTVMIIPLRDRTIQMETAGGPVSVIRSRVCPSHSRFMHSSHCYEIPRFCPKSSWQSPAERRRESTRIHLSFSPDTLQ